MKKLLTLALCALFAFHAAEARTLYVDAKRPNNKGNGLSVKKAKKTIQAAINVAKAGDTILVYPGTYAPIKTNNKKITIKSVKGVKKTKIVKPNKPAQKITLASLGKKYTVYLDTHGTKDTSGVYTKGTKSTLEGFLIDGMFRTISSDGTGALGKLIGVSGGTVKACSIQRIGNKFADTYGGFPHYADAIVVANANLQDCTLKNNRARYISESKYDNHVATTFLRCKIQKNDTDGGFGWESALVNCLVTDNIVMGELFSNATLFNCTVAKNVSYQYWSDGLFSGWSKYYNCILWKNYTVAPKSIQEVYAYNYYDEDGENIGWRSAHSSTVYLSYYDADGNYVSQEATESILARLFPVYTRTEEIDNTTVPGKKKTLHNVDKDNTYKNTSKVNKDPKFVNAAKGDYRLKKGSYAIDKGKLTKAQKKLVGAKDLAGKKRVKGKAIDLGCYEL